MARGGGIIFVCSNPLLIWITCDPSDSWSLNILIFFTNVNRDLHNYFVHKSFALLCPFLPATTCIRKDHRLKNNAINTAQDSNAGIRCIDRLLCTAGVLAVLVISTAGGAMLSVMR